MFCFDLILESRSNLVLFWSYTWKPVKLDSVLVLHLKASQTCSSNFTICLFTWTYPSLPVWLCFWLCHAVYLIGLTTLTPMWKCFKSSLVGIWAFWKLWSVWNYLFSPQRFFWSFYQMQEPSHSVSLFQIRKHISDAMCYAMYDHEWHVWVFKLVFHLNLFCSSVLGCFAFLRPCVLYGPAYLVYYASILYLESIFSLDVFLSYHNFLCVQSLKLWFFNLVVGGIPDLPPFPRVGFLKKKFISTLSINHAWVMKSFQGNAFNLIMQTNKLHKCIWNGKY